MSKLSVTYNSIIIVESLPDNECKTGKLLATELKKSQPDQEGVQYVPVASKDEFIELMQEMKYLMTENEGFRPIIDIETHGNEEVTQFADGSQISWGDLMEILRGINQICKNELVVFLACCKGYHFIKSTTITKHSPCGYLYSPKEDILITNVVEATVEFFKEIIVNGDLDDAADLMRVRKIYCFKSEIVFLNELTKALIRDFEGKNMLHTDSLRKNFIEARSEVFLGSVKNDYTNHVIKCFHEHIKSKHHN
ncbi:hypothetical protein ACWXV2_19975 [Pantoea ananatis]